jgi:hypothetical protein
MRWRAFRTALCAGALILAGAGLAATGGGLIAFARTESALRAYFAAQEAGDPGPSGMTARSLRESVDRWVDTPILRPRARRYAIALAPLGAAAADRLLATLDAYLSVQPADASYWLRRGELALALGAPLGGVRAAFDLASFLAPNEAGVKLERVMFGLRLWEIAKPLQRQRIVADLVAIRARLGGARLAALRQAVAGKDDAAKAEMRDLLRRAGPENARWARRIGL